jgi:hypothetical protein
VLGMERVRLDPHTLEIYLAEEPPQHSPLVVACAGVASLAVAVRLLRSSTPCSGRPTTASPGQ